VNAGQEPQVTPPRSVRWNFPISRHRLTNVVADAALIGVAWWLTFWLRFDRGVPYFYEHLLSWQTFVVVISIKLVVFALFGFYNRWWRYVSTRDMWGAARGVVVASLLVDLTLYAFPPADTARLPRGVALIDMLLLLAFVAGSRLLARTLIERPATGLVARGKAVLVVGAGDAGGLVLRELQRNPKLGSTPIGLVDDDPRKKNLRVHGVRVLGTTSQLRQILRETEPDEVLIAIPSASGELRGRIVDAAAAEDIPVKTLPGLYELISGDLDLARQIRPVQVEDVLGREPVEVDLASVAQYLAAETVLVTGAGGSIGSELCRQISRLGPARIVMVDQAETPLHEIERELVEHGFTAALPVLADVRSERKLRHVFEKYEPDVVFHTAAYKHVYLMETNPVESVNVNVLGTRVIAQLAVEFEAKRLVGRARRRRDAVLRRPLRQRPQLRRLGDPDLPAADRPRRARDRDAPGDDALLHDHSGGGEAHPPCGSGRPQRRRARAQHGPADPHHRPCARPHSSLVAGRRPGHRHRLHRPPSGREAGGVALRRKRGSGRDRLAVPAGRPAGSHGPNGPGLCAAARDAGRRRP
jgi:hypothetical protein